MSKALGLVISGIVALGGFPHTAFALDWRSGKIDLRPKCPERTPDVEFEFGGHFSAANAYLALHFAYYDLRWNESRIRRQLNAFGFDDVSFHSKPGIHAFTASSPELTYVHFEGTHDFRSTISDAHFGVRPATALGLPGRVHMGFEASFLDVRSKIAESLRKRRGKSAPVLFSGHSYGASLATLAAVDAVRAGRRFEALYTSGQPRLGDEELLAAVAGYLEGRHHRLVFERDMVPHIPPRAEAAHEFGRTFGFLGPVAKYGESLAHEFRYGHMAPVHWIDQGTLRFVDDDVAFDGEYWRELDEAPAWSFPAIVTAFTHHDPGRYICALGKAALGARRFGKN